MVITNLEPFKDFVRGFSGLHLEGVGQEKLAAALDERIRKTGSANERDYLQLIMEDVAERLKLINILTINETYFFREPDQIHLLTERMIPRLLESRMGLKQVNILSAGCSSGEEPYSVAIALWEKYHEAFPRFCWLLGVDIDSSVLSRARAGRYGDFSFRGTPEEVRQRYFDQDGHFWQLKPCIREAVTFREMNLQNFSARDLPPFDIILFRNVSIYYDLSTRRQVQQNMFSLLKEDGFFLTSSTETLGNDLGIFRMVEENGLYYFVKGSPLVRGQKKVPENSASVGVQKKVPSVFQAVPPPPHLTLPSSWKKWPPEEKSVEELARMVREGLYDEVLPLLTIHLSAHPEDYRIFLLQSYVLLNRKQFEQAAAASSRALELHSWSVDALVLLGLTSRWLQKPEESMSWFKQAVYACPACWPAHYYLADLHIRSGAVSQAKRSYRTALQLLSRTGAETGLEIVPDDLPAEEIRRLCEHHLASLNGRTEE
ncbi:MAG TPA: CheR family methyltransferase [Smithellaceae bacterium]|nr:CheR family methyltransferase [Smithellaceae bacterium]